MDVKKLIKGKGPIPPFEYTGMVTKYHCNINGDKPSVIVNRIRNYIFDMGYSFPKVFEYNDIASALEEGIPVVLVDLSYYKNDSFITHYKWFQITKKRK